MLGRFPKKQKGINRARFHFLSLVKGDLSLTPIRKGEKRTRDLALKTREPIASVFRV